MKVNEEEEEGEFDMDSSVIGQEQAEKIGYRDILSQKQFMKIIFADVISRFGDSIDAIAFTWLVYSAGFGYQYFKDRIRLSAFQE